MASIVAERNEVNIEHSYSDTIYINLNDTMLKLDEPVTISINGEPYWTQSVDRSIANIYSKIKTQANSSPLYPAKIRIIHLGKGDYRVEPVH